MPRLNRAERDRLHEEAVRQFFLDARSIHADSPERALEIARLERTWKLQHNDKRFLKSLRIAGE